MQGRTQFSAASRARAGPLLGCDRRGRVGRRDGRGRTDGRGRHGAGDSSTAPRLSATQEPASFWWREFRDAELDKLVDQATEGNLNLKVAYLRIVEARIQVQSARAQGLPSLNASASYNREQLGLAGILKSKGIGNSGPTSSAEAQQLIGALEQPVNLYQLGFDASWEIDLFGKVRRQVEAADAQSAGAIESRNDMLISLEAEVAQTYLQLRAAQVSKSVTLELIAAQREIADLTQNRHEHGLAGEPDVDSARAQLTSLEAELPAYEQTISSCKHALAVLTGQDPEALDAQFEEPGQLPAIPQSIPVGVPSTLARRRPDIRNAETALHAATAQIGISVASLYPDVSLAGSLGLRNSAPVICSIGRAISTRSARRSRCPFSTGARWSRTCVCRGRKRRRRRSVIARRCSERCRRWRTASAI